MNCLATVVTGIQMNLNLTVGEAPGSSLRPASNFSMNYETDVFENDLVLSLYFFFPLSVKTMK